MSDRQLTPAERAQLIGLVLRERLGDDAAALALPHGDEQRSGARLDSD